MKTNNHQKIKRLAINLAALLIIIGVIFLGNFLTAPKVLTSQDINLPALKNQVAPDGVRIDLKTGSFQVAIRLNQDGQLDDSHAADMLALYHWVQEYFGEYKCGPDYPPNLCVFDKVEFLFVDATETMSEEGLPQTSLFKMVLIGLDQVQIDKLLAIDPQPTTIQALMEYLGQVAKGTNYTGVFYEEFANEPYLGLNK